MRTGPEILTPRRVSCGGCCGGIQEKELAEKAKAKAKEGGKDKAPADKSK